jgi:hypothetical protein
MWNWIKAHPQRVAGFLIVVFSQVQGALAMLQAPMPPLVAWGVNTSLGIIVAALAWAVKNLKDEEPLPTQETPQ